MDENTYSHCFKRGVSCDSRAFLPVFGASVSFDSHNEMGGFCGAFNSNNVYCFCRYLGFVDSSGLTHRRLNNMVAGRFNGYLRLGTWRFVHFYKKVSELAGFYSKTFFELSILVEEFIGRFLAVVDDAHLFYHNRKNAFVVNADINAIGITVGVGKLCRGFYGYSRGYAAPVKDEVYNAEDKAGKSAYKSDYRQYGRPKNIGVFNGVLGNSFNFHSCINAALGKYFNSKKSERTLKWILR